MFERQIFSSLEAHFTEKEFTVITGMRCTGKTTALRFLLEKTPHAIFSNWFPCSAHELEANWITKKSGSR